MMSFFFWHTLYKRKTFNCVEQSKATFFSDYKTARAIIGTKDPSRQNFLSKHISGFVKHKWHDKRDDLMEELINCKFSQSPHLVEKLFTTGISYDN